MGHRRHIRAARHADGAAGRRARRRRRRVPPSHLRAPHILGVGFPKGMPDQLVERLAAQHIFVARRIGRLRISPHVYNDEADVDRFLEAFVPLLA